MFIAAGILVGLSVLLFALGRGQGRKAGDMTALETSVAAELKDLAKAVGDEIGPGSFNRMVELKGKAESDQPLRSEMAGEACVWYRCTVTREYEETRMERDSDGHSRSSTHRGSETVSSSERRSVFSLRDQSGDILVDPEGAKVDGEKILSRYEPGERGTSITIGGFSVSIGQPGLGKRTLGYKLEEWILPLGKDLYVLGEARDDGGRLRVCKPSAKGGRFVISVKSEEQLVKSARKGQLALSILSGAFLAIAAVLAALKLFRAG